MAYLYILTNNSFPGCVKIGCTARYPSSRARELYTTGVPSPFIVSEYWEVAESKMYQLEKDVHKYLHKFRQKNNREFFKLPSSSAKRYIDEYLSKYTDIIEKREQAKKREQAIYRWKREWRDIFSQSFIDAENDLGYTHESLKKLTDTPLIKIKDLFVAIISFCTLFVLPVLLSFIGIDFETAEEKQAEKMRNELSNRRDEIFYKKRKEYFKSHGIESLTEYELKIVEDTGFSWNPKYKKYI